MNQSDVQPWIDLADLIFNNLIFLIFAYFFWLKGLNFRRLTLLGRMLCIVALTMGMLWFMAFLRQWFPQLDSPWFKWPLRAYMLLMLFRALQAMAWTYGGWRAVHKRAWRNLKEIVRLRRIPIEYGPQDRWVD